MPATKESERNSKYISEVKKMRAKTMLSILITALVLLAAWKIGGVLLDAYFAQMNEIGRAHV